MKLYFFITIGSFIEKSEIEKKIHELAERLDSPIKKLTTSYQQTFFQNFFNIPPEFAFIELYELTFPDRDDVRDLFIDEFQKVFEPLYLDFIELVFFIHIYREMRTPWYSLIDDELVQKEELESEEKDRFLDALVDHGYGGEMDPSLQAKFLLMAHSF